ncbi:glycoside hydrolase family 3 N-terminal domain-containing protein [Umezawaea sp. Da 62-37]|uniref:glycoside hydrolase family 3 N-terminal domain-containing protein n=1 Tax=Umezawaea sp. Da 62-37 TaxID=3075927 RepID=UPI0028F6D71E|nr:glycoside hydrolase family 3 N-terminal domain-containing protein [Umezawaea sp. Da 62-37]WNV84737.1 glycoside hydrolase family 3 N-terminal domain-containing protein [Umezawaea sp. Da 62-37]
MTPRGDALAEQVDVLIRPSRAVVVDSRREDLLVRETGAGSGRIGKDVVRDAGGLAGALRLPSAAGPGLPLLISVNQEGGRLDALDWPAVAQLAGNLAVGAIGCPETAHAAGAAIGGQLRAVGLTWDLAPVCDLGSWPSTSAVGTRAFGSEPGLVARLAAGFVRGLQSAGVAGTAKHFPGLGGVATDPHHAVPVLDRLRPGSLLPFQAAIDAGVAAVMVGSHVVLEFDDRPAVFSPGTVRFLREEMGFDGVIVSENLSIPAVHESVGGVVAAAVAALAAGVDVVMLDSEVSRGRGDHAAVVAAVRTRDRVAAAVVAAVLDGRVDPDRVAEAARRVRSLHDRFGLTDATQRPAWADVDTAAAEAARLIGDRSVTVLRGGHLLPLPDTAGGLVVLVRVPDGRVARADSAHAAPDLVPDLWATDHRPVLRVRPGDPIPEGAAAIVFYGYDTGPDLPSLAAAEAARLTGRGVPVVQVAFGVPDDLVSSPADVLIAAYSPHRASVAACASVLWGPAYASGRLAVAGHPW